jgi:hypothetical protein
MKWVTWEHVGVDRMGCAWLILRFVDSQAEFEFIAAGKRDVPKDSEPFDIPGVRLSHHEGHSSFHTILNEYQLEDPLLQRMAAIVDEADDVVEGVSLEPIAAGLDYLCRGLRLISDDDQTALERGRLIYEALYRQLAADSTQ